MANGNNHSGRHPPPGKGPARAGQQHPPQRPVHEVRFGRVKAAIWASTTQYRVRYTVKVSKVYKGEENGEEKWQTTDVFYWDDLLALAKVVDHAHTWINEQGATEDIPF